MDNSLTGKNHEIFSERLEVPGITILIPIIIFELLALVVAAAARSGEVLMVGGNALPISAFSGVVTAISNICIIVMVLVYRKLGFVVSLVILLIQIPRLIMGIVATHSLASIPGIFINVTTIITVVILYLNQVRLESERRRLHNLFVQTATAMVNAIDAKDKYTHGHSTRVADYSRRLAQLGGKNENECDIIYYSALLHDVGKIGIPVSIINKSGKLTTEEYDLVKQHPVLGAQILRNILEYPFLSVGANFHHERYDGKGYPNGLKGEEIPELARIISVADAYDAMTSKRSYRDPIPQQKVREEIVTCIGTQFDPVYARHMISLIDEDFRYEMKEREEREELAGEDTELVMGEYRENIADGILITDCQTVIYMNVTPDKKAGASAMPSMLLFDSLDGCFHSEEREINDLIYFEYGVVRFDGQTDGSGARKFRTEILSDGNPEIDTENEYIVRAVRIKDHARIRIESRGKTIEVIVALPDNTRFLYLGLTGEHCRISGLRVEKTDEVFPEDFIPRIAEEISFIKGPAGDIPNLQVDGFRTGYSEGIQVKDKMKISFHTMSLPTARLVWHCPFILFFDSEDGQVNGPEYREFAHIRLNGESAWSEDVQNDMVIDKKKEFRGWQAWKDLNKKGMDCTISIEKTDNKILVRTENLGIRIESTLTFNDDPGRIYLALTGDQVALTGIRIR